MNTSVFLTLGACCCQNASIFNILLLLIIVALMVWLIIWLLFGCCGGSDEVSQGAEETTSGSDEETGNEVEPEDAQMVESEEETESDSEEEEAAFEAASEEDARSLFAAELESGSVRQDPVYGIIYDGVPDGGADDLKRIKGVAQVLEGKLNSIGVYRFKQVAVWTEAACEEFSKLLTFKGRIYSDNWLAQAKEFHEEKYDEKL